jgi:hypothetical protein
MKFGQPGAELRTTVLEMENILVLRTSWALLHKIAQGKESFMKLSISEFRRTLCLAGVVAAGVLLFTSCVVTSVYPFYTDKDLIFEQSLLGDWVDAATTNEPADYVRVERLGEKAYSVTAYTSSETNSTEAHLFRLKQQLFLDVFPTNRSLDYVPVHQVSKVTAVAPEVQSATLNYDWLSKLLEKKPEAIRHLVLPDKPGDAQGGRLVLTAGTAQLQRFILKHLDNTNAWNEPSKWKHRN